ncbi:phosphate ABC transporter substrate-binding protein, PhoT family [Terriglobus roseus DSM 18391]|uniref:Phosphate-binding protein n=1 Tax=Terriglobus roseus (strain DSM 18391 / NRRL B-41598 / KBS 63) TaxID=926566 RepID=I3ZDN4_TERRK|nr:phosphate ABC transporter substrate-binding protein PstS [Terriglobus roseus]AFL87352.1 phosphate ABC transporter substrate-binding protein, PhoT family [Terriglobus roseus DSM 18391]
MKIKVLSAIMGAALLTGMAGAQQLNGAGATFPNPIYSKWFSEYSASHPGVTINYQSVGSGAGIRQASDGIVDFGASDGPMTDEQMNSAKVKLFHIPTVMGAVVPTYNLPGVGELKFSGDIIADIYLGKITNWKDGRIAAINPGVNLPDHQILPVYRSDGSGTTYIWTDFLSKNSSDFQSRIGKATSVRWTVGIGQKGNEGIAGMVRNSPYSFGYVELIYALQNKMSFGTVKNPAGKFIKASPETVSAAAAGAAKSMPNDFRVSITNAPGADSYPVSSFTWLLIPTKSPDAKKGEILRDFLKWMIAHGESEAVGLSYAPLPPAVAMKVSGAINYLK